MTARATRWNQGMAPPEHLSEASGRRPVLIVSIAAGRVGCARTLIGPEVTGEHSREVRVLDRARYVVTREHERRARQTQLLAALRSATLRLRAYHDGKLDPGPATTDQTFYWLCLATSDASPPPDGIFHVTRRLTGLGSMDDSAWPRVRLPTIDRMRSSSSPSRMGPSRRSSCRQFEVRIRRPVKSCRISLTMWARRGLCQRKESVFAAMCRATTDLLRWPRLCQGRVRNQ